MSDGLDPRHAPCHAKEGPQLDAWVHELTMLLFRRGAIRSDASLKMVADEIETFASQVVRATRDGWFREVG